MDERLEAGRHHLLNGDKALDEGYLDDSRSHFEAALLQFRGPELRLGEAHALRGLARVELGTGNLGSAEQAARAAIAQYGEVRAILRRIDREGLSVEIGRDAEEGEGAALVLLGDILARTGRAEEARATLGIAREIYASLGDVPSAAGVWHALGRLALRDDRLDLAREGFERAAGVCARSGDRAGECHAWLGVAEIHRLDQRFPAAEEALAKAVALARGHHQRALLGRALSHQGAFLAQLARLDEARACYEEALPRIVDSGDVEAEGFACVGLGDVGSQQGRPDAVHDLIRGARLLGSLDHHHGLGGAMLRLASHALRVSEPGLALASAESARQLWYHLDPVRGVGQALRIAVKALAACKRWPAVLAVAHLRANVAGAVQPNAIEVREHYRARTAKHVLDDLDALSREALEDRADALIAATLDSLLAPLDLDPTSLGTVGGALAVIDAIEALGPLVPVPSATPAPVPRHRAPVAPTPPAPVEPTNLLGSDGHDRADVPPVVAAPGYEEQDTEDATEDPSVDRLRRLPQPDDYADLYAPPEDDETRAR